VSPVSHVLDTSALLAHYFDEPGAALVEELLTEESSEIAISAVTVAELKGRLHQELHNDLEAMNAADAYLDELTTCLPVDRAIAELAWQLRLSVPDRLPLADALIAATARAADAVLVHRDPHMSLIPEELVRQIVLPHTSQGP
jgi:predicted nucleic acid-binding protein